MGAAGRRARAFGGGPVQAAQRASAAAASGAEQGRMVPAVWEPREARGRFASTHPVRHHGQLLNKRGAEGICHATVAERYALPDQVVTGTGSHTQPPGALGALAFGTGATDIADS